jgi:DNA-binding SARP family transcriptional activator
VASDPLCGRAALLRIHGIFTVARERLAELVWAGRGTEQANGSLRQELVRLRRTIGEEALPWAGT